MSDNSDNLKGWMSDKVQDALSKIDMGAVFEPMTDQPNSSNEECPCLRVDGSGICSDCGNDVVRNPKGPSSGNASELAKDMRNWLNSPIPANLDRANADIQSAVVLMERAIGLPLLPSTERVSISREAADECS